MITKSKYAVMALIVAGLFATFQSTSALASAENQQYLKRLKKSVSISNNSGGRILSYAIKVTELKRSGTLVRFSGRCDSACTLYLGLPTNQTCVSPGAYFRFHSPSAGSQRSARMAQVYMMGKYPGWVRNWIARNNGLSRQLITMDYGYASKFLKQCSRVASR
jgi:hypothetical protein